MASTQFRLPGFSNRINVTKFNLSTAYAFSRSFNPRNIELRWYGVWDVVLNALVSDRRRLIVIPQHILYYVPRDDDSEESDPLNIVDMEDDMEDEATAAISDNVSASSVVPATPSADNESIHTMASPTSTVAAGDVPFVIPDFGIIHLEYRRRTSDGGRNWKNIKIRWAGTPSLVELKRLPSRSISEALLGTALKDKLRVAQNTVMRQAGYLFHMNRKQKSVVLIAGSGIYWTCRIAYPKDTLEYAGVMQHEDMEFLPPTDEPDSDGSDNEMEDVDPSKDADLSEDEDDELDSLTDRPVYQDPRSWHGGVKPIPGDDP